MRLPQPEFSKQLRRDQTDAERKMWFLLRSRSLAGYKFRRQQPIGQYIVDFCCLRPRLIVELDGGQHADQVGYDQRRTDFLRSEGFQVVRFWDNQVLKEMDAVMEVILKALTAAPLTPTLSHVGEREKRGNRNLKKSLSPTWERARPTEGQGARHTTGGRASCVAGAAGEGEGVRRD